METFTEPRDFEYNPNFTAQRRQSLQSIDLSDIDLPVVDIVVDFTKLYYCFTLQICTGHFLYTGQTNPHNLESLPLKNEIQEVEYRIAYIALCIDDTHQGRKLLDDLAKIPLIDPAYIQFGSADWFWERQVNSYTLQVEPTRFMCQDRARVDYQEAQHIENVRNDFFRELRKVLSERLGRNGLG